MRYRIKIEYKTGNSFRTFNTEDYVECSWEKLEVAKENLARIKEHYKYYQSCHDYYLSREIKDIKKEAEKKPWYSSQYDFCVKLKLDDGTETDYCSFWCGYFEKPYSAEIVQDPDSDSDLKISF